MFGEKRKSFYQNIFNGKMYFNNAMKNFLGAEEGTKDFLSNQLLSFYNGQNQQTSVQLTGVPRAPLHSLLTL